MKRWRWRFLGKRDAAVLVDSLRRTTELLEAAWQRGVQPAPGWFTARDAALREAREIVRRVDPDRQTDMTVDAGGIR